MKKLLVLIAFSLIFTLMPVACDSNSEQVAETTAAQETEPATQEVTTEQPTTEEITTEEPTTEQETEAETQMTVSIEEVQAAAITFFTPEMIRAAAENPEQDWSDFGGMTVNEDGSVKALFRTGMDDKWDPYCYLVKEYVAAGDIAVIQYRSAYNFGVNLYIGSEGNVATGPSEHVQAAVYVTKDDEWGYLVVNLADDALCYDTESGVLGFLRFGLDDAEPGDTVDFGFVAFFANMEEAAKVLPVSDYLE